MQNRGTLTSNHTTIFLEFEIFLLALFNSWHIDIELCHNFLELKSSIYLQNRVAISINLGTITKLQNLIFLVIFCFKLSKIVKNSTKIHKKNHTTTSHHCFFPNMQRKHHLNVFFPCLYFPSLL